MTNVVIGCDNVVTEAYHGHKACKRRCFYGLNICMMAAKAGQPDDFLITPNSSFYRDCAHWFDLDTRWRASRGKLEAITMYVKHCCLRVGFIGGATPEAVYGSITRIRLHN